MTKFDFYSSPCWPRCCRWWSADARYRAVRRPSRRRPQRVRRRWWPRPRQQPAIAAPQPASVASQSDARRTAADAASHPACEAAAPPPTALETRYGIQITQIGLTASDGLVDVRFKVLDAAKAQEAPRQPGQHAGADCRKQPAAGTAAPRAARRQVRRRARLLHPVPECPRNAIKHGVEVTVAMGDVRLGPVTVQ